MTICIKESPSKKKVGTKEFAEAVGARIGQKPETLKPVTYAANIAETKPKPIFSSPTQQNKELVGADVFLDLWNGSFYGVVNELGALVEKVSGDGLKLQITANRGVKVYPGGFSDTFAAEELDSYDFLD